MRVSGRVLLSVLLLVCSITSVLDLSDVSAAQITLRKLTLETGTQTLMGGSTPGSVSNSSVNHKFDMTLPNAGSVNVGSILMEYCTTAALTCTMPTGLATNNSSGGSNPGTTLVAGGSQSGMGAAFTLVTSTNGAPYLTRTASAITAGSAVSWRIDNVTNPTASNTTFFVRISTFASTNATGSPIDTGVVAASTANVITVNGTMPESLTFCTGGTITMVGSVPDCSTATSGSVTFTPQLFSTSTTSVATSDMAASTNATQGYVITVSGSTLTSGANTITAIGGTATTSAPGTRQFGMNLAVNTTPAVGAAINPTSNVSFLRALAATNYDTPDNFAFVAGGANTVIARSDNNTPGTPAPTDAQRYTSSYIANVSGSVAAGAYVATLTYVCTPTF